MDRKGNDVSVKLKHLNQIWHRCHIAPRRLISLVVLPQIFFAHFGKLVHRAIFQCGWQVVPGFNIPVREGLSSKVGPCRGLQEVWMPRVIASQHASSGYARCGVEIGGAAQALFEKYQVGVS
jgi:hypothetical protein